MGCPSISQQVNFRSGSMHPLFSEVLTHKDLSKAGELFTIEDKDIQHELSEVVDRIYEIADQKGYEESDNDQSVVEICITRVTTAIRETSSIEEHARALVKLLEMCHRHKLTTTIRDEDPPHAKIASDIMSCLFMHYNKKPVMKLAIPAVVHYLDCDNKELGRNVSSYLSLAAIDNAELLAKHMPILVMSVLKGNYLLSNVLPQIFTQNPDPVIRHIDCLVSTLDKCEMAEHVSLIQLFSLVAKQQSQVLEKHYIKLCEYLTSNMTASMVISIFVDMAKKNPASFTDRLDDLKQILVNHPPLTYFVIQIIGFVGTLNEAEADRALKYFNSMLKTSEDSALPMILQEMRAIGLTHPELLSPYMEEVNKLSTNVSSAVRIHVQSMKEDQQKYLTEKEMISVSSQTEGTVTVITVGNPPNALHPSGTVSIKPTTVLSQNTADSDLSLPKSILTSDSRLASERTGSPTSTLVSEHLSINSNLTSQYNSQNEPVHDGVLHFCEKHFTTIQNYVEKIGARLPLPAKCSVVNGKHRRYVKLHFQCASPNEHCLYGKSHFILDTYQPRIWLHLMFLSIQAQSSSALSQRDLNVSNLKVCWDALKGERSGGTFLTLITSAFPSMKDQEMLQQELHEARYFDIFEFNALNKQWCCFMCNHPEKVTGLLQDGLPLIAGQLKEKKGKWKFLKRWKTRYFTLSGGQFTYSKSDLRKETLSVSKIQSVKAVRKGIRDIPRAFEIFTDDQTYVFKAKGHQNVEQWVQCLHIAVAHSQNTQNSDVLTSNHQENTVTEQLKPVITDTKL
ncbi:hypothetical protein LOTGIDRAFT_234384 [Lottia gigantea]|uniref:PH domain-containing protein n=1 Tax=Lottia gigantea TaxID=225164 RepID=V4A1I0_LOTGI|nr:hypothetical protein LOTGIDRAFT_234384 [Lottia gigantea]ESO88785.1 hypothetical protein LOTGIDRAFT_234384 [Lottia gigantea]